MDFHIKEFKPNQKRSKNSAKNKRLNVRLVTITLISFLLLSSPLTVFSTTVYGEPTLTTLLNELGFTNIGVSNAETFPPGTYKATLFAEFGEFSDINILSYYPVGTQSHQTIFTGSEGSTGGSENGYVIPPISKLFEVDSEFGLSLFAPYRYFTEDHLNPDYPEEHARVLTNLDSPGMLLICFEDTYGGFDRDYNDMVISLEKINTPQIVSVTRSPKVPRADQSVTVTAQVTKGSAEIESVVLRYQIESSTWVNLPMSLGSAGYVANIPAQPQNTQVNYRVYASDTEGHTDLSQIYSYTPAVDFGSLPFAEIVKTPTETVTGETVELDASNSYDSDGTISSYLWDFGDGTNSTEVTIGHSYEEDGEYTITLKVTDNQGLTSSKVVLHEVKNRPPVADLNNPKLTINRNELVSFDASTSYDVDGEIVTYTWSFGDGQAAAGVTVTHSYVYPGFYILTLTVNDNDGATDEYKQSIQVTQVLNEPPVAAFVSSVKTVGTEQIVSFDASDSYDPDGTIDFYSWDFGDGVKSTGVAKEHTYRNAGTYTVTLTVIDNDAGFDKVTSTITVTEEEIILPDGTNENESPVALFTSSVESMAYGESVHFDASESYDSDGTIVSYFWNFGDGNESTGMIADHTYNETGTYTVTLTVTDNDGDSSSTNIDVSVIESEATEATMSLGVLSAIGLGVTALTATLLVHFFVRRKRKNRKTK